MFKKSFPIKIIGVSLILLFNTLLAHAQVIQTGQLAILPGAIYVAQIPSNFSLPKSFIPATQETVTLYKTLDPTILSEILTVIDVDPTGDFKITVSLDDFTSTTGGSNTIHYTNMGIVTLSQSLTEPVDSGAGNVPPGAPNISAPLNCNWNPQTDPNMEDACDTFMTNFTESGDPTSQPIDILINPVAADTGEYSIGFGLKFSFDDTVVSDTYTSTLTFDLIFPLP